MEWNDLAPSHFAGPVWRCLAPEVSVIEEMADKGVA